MMAVAALAGLDLLATAIVIVDRELIVRFVNPAAENLFELSSKNFVGNTLTETFEYDRVLGAAIAYTRANHCSYTEHALKIGVPGHAKLHLSCTLSPVEIEGWVAGWSGRADSLVVQPPVGGERAMAPAPASGRSANVLQGLLLEFRHIDQQIRIEREERLHDQSQANRELIRNLAHEIKNPLGGIRGAAQLLERELDAPHLIEYTQVIISESDRLQSLVNRLLTPHRLPRFRRINIHEIVVRVKGLVQAEFPQVAITPDLDISLPDFEADPEQLMQAVLNVVRNAAQAVSGTTADPHIRLITRVARYVTLARKRHRLALALGIADNGPGVPESIRDKIFYPLVSGREGGSGLGLTIAQTFVAQHNGTIECESAPGRTVFTILLPLEPPRAG